VLCDLQPVVKKDVVAAEAKVEDKVDEEVNMLSLFADIES
jgi:hypothetical protein